MVFGLFKRKQNAPRIERYRILYQAPTPEDVQALQQADWAILEPRFVTKGIAAALRAAGTEMFGYLSVMETPTWNAERYGRLHKDDFWEADGELMHFPEWDSYLMDLRSPHYRALLLDEVQEQVVRRELDGLFLDTVGDLGEYIPAGPVREEMQAAYRDLLDEILRLAPELKLVQNRGFDSLPLVGGLLHGFLWEDWRGDLLHDEWVRLRVKDLADRQRRGLQVLTVSASDAAVHGAAARRHGFVHLACTQGYHTLQGQT